MKSALLWNTYGGDIEWFEYSARSFSKFATGWDYVKCIVPSRDAHLFTSVCEKNNITLATFDEWPGQGFNHHQAMTCWGETHFPDDAEVIFHIDADCVFASPCFPADWLPGGKILLPFVDFSFFLTTPLRHDEKANFMGCSGLLSDFKRGQYLWKFAADFALGWSVERETMAWMPIAHHRDVYIKTREIIAERHKMPFEEYVKSCRNEFPQTFCEFNTLGGVAHKYFEDRYHWNNFSTQGPAFAGKVIQCWSRGGFDRPHEFDPPVGGYQTPRQLFERLGLC